MIKVILSVMICASALAQQPPAQTRAANNMFPQWSHEGKKIAFTSDRDGDPEIYVINLTAK